MTTTEIDVKPAFDYKTSVEEANLSYVKFRFSDGEDETEEVKLPKFTGDGGLEALLYVEEEFRNVQEEHEWNSNACFKHFKKLLGGTALTRWKNVLQSLTVAERNHADAFNQTIKKLHLKYCTSTARDTMYEYLRSSECRKPRSVSPRDHAERLKTMIRYASKLPGEDPILTAYQIKTIIFNSMPETCVGDLVLMKTIDPIKLEPRAVGPFPITQVYTNGTVDVQKSPHTQERVNIRRIVPYKV